MYLSHMVFLSLSLSLPLSLKINKTFKKNPQIIFPLPLFLLWQNAHNIKLTMLTVCNYTRFSGMKWSPIVVQPPAPPSVSRTTHPPWNLGTIELPLPAPTPSPWWPPLHFLSP